MESLLIWRCWELTLVRSFQEHVWFFKQANVVRLRLPICISKNDLVWNRCSPFFPWIRITHTWQRYFSLYCITKYNPNVAKSFKTARVTSKLDVRSQNRDFLLFFSCSVSLLNKTTVDGTASSASHFKSHEMDISWGTQTSWVVFNHSQVITCDYHIFYDSYCFTVSGGGQYAIKSYQHWLPTCLKENEASGTSSFLPLGCKERFPSNQSPTSWLFEWWRTDSSETHLTHNKQWYFQQPFRRFHHFPCFIHPRSKDTKLQPPKSWSQTQRTPRPRQIRRRPTSWAAEVRRQEAISDRYLDGKVVMEVGFEDLCQPHSYFFSFFVWGLMWNLILLRKECWGWFWIGISEQLELHWMQPVLYFVKDPIWDVQFVVACSVHLHLITVTIKFMTNCQPFVRNTVRIKEKWITRSIYSIL